jgi:hypothetical protein
VIIGGKRARANIPVCQCSDRVKFSKVLNGTALVVAHTFTDFGRVHEILVDVPVLADSATIYLTICDGDYSALYDHRFTSSALGEDAVHIIHCFNCKGKVILLDRLVQPGDTIQLRANAAATEVVTGIIYEVGA